jgi:hypothetical protein
MERFDHKGMMIIPNPVPKTSGTRNCLIAHELFCPNGHNLISSRAVFNSFPGILLGVGLEETKGLVALSPICGDKTRVALDVDLPEGRIATLFCPTCGTGLPVYANCACGADLVALFLTRETNFMDCIGVCNRIGCINARIVTSGDLVSDALLENL